jgi:hypothetical protein
MKHQKQEHQSSPAPEEHPNQEEVARRAYELFQARGGEPGRELQDWVQAEEEVNNRRPLVYTAG